jgi:acetyl esterase/lipase
MKKIIRFILITTSILLLLITLGFIGVHYYGNKLIEQAGRIESWEDSDGLILSDISYGPRSLNIYDLYLPNDSFMRDNVGPDTVGLMLYIHGGSWSSGDKEEGNWFCRRFTKAGYVTATMNYSLINYQESTVSIPTMLKEISYCISSIQSKASEHGIVIHKMGIAGYSAGAHLAMLYSNKMHENSPIPIAFNISLAGPTDLSIIFKVPSDTIDAVKLSLNNGNVHPQKSEIDALTFFCSGQNDLKIDNYTSTHIDSIIQHASPIYWINKDSKPTIFAYGEKDQLVKPLHYQQAIQLYDSLEIKYQLISYPNSGHLLAKDPDCSTRLSQNIKEFANNYLK